VDSVFWVGEEVDGFCVVVIVVVVTIVGLGACVNADLKY
jgi:hypothetical protein